MSTFYQFFEMNIHLVIFVYGSIFFMIGFAIFLKNRKHSKFNLAKSLHWLALFGIIHAFADWGQMFIPIQKEYSSEQTYVILKTVRIVINTLSFMFLMQFGISLLIDTKNAWKKLKYVPTIVFTLWLTQFIFYKLFFDILGNELWWIRVNDIWSRYFIAFPSAFISGYAIILQKKQFIKFGYTKFIKALNLAGISLIVYGITAGLIVPEGPIYFAHLVNSELFFQITGIPIELLRAICGVLISISVLMIISVFDIEYIRRLQEIEKEKAVYEERNRIAQDLHDGIIQSMYATNLQMEVINHLIDSDPKQASEKLSICLARRNQTINQIREYIGEIKRVTDTEYSLKERILEIIDELNLNEKINISLIYSYNGDQLTVTKLYHLTLLIKEALSNVRKHANAKKLFVIVGSSHNKLKIEIIDDGKGFNLKEYDSNSKLGMHQGIANIRARVKSLNGHLQIDSSKEKGTTLTIEVPMEGDSN